MSMGLTLNGVRAGYDESIVLEDVSLTLDKGSSLAILGRNGAGKSTLLATLAGATRQHSGTIMLDGHDLRGTPSHIRARMGIGWVPQERCIFTSLTVEENLAVVARPGPWNLEQIYARFPRLAERRCNLGSELSGGEQQMLAIARALMLNPRVLLLDEPLEGLAPLIAREVLNIVAALIHDSSMSMLLVEQHPQQVLPVTQHAVILERGRIVHRARSKELLRDAASQNRWLGIGPD